ADIGAELRIPQWLARVRVEREEVAFVRAAKYESTRGRQQTTKPWRQQLEFPFQLPCRCLQRANRSPGFVAVHRAPAAGSEAEPGFVHRFALEEDRPPFAGDLIKEAGLRAVAWAVPVRGPGDARIHQDAFDRRLQARLDARPPLRIETVRPRLLH